MRVVLLQETGLMGTSPAGGGLWKAVILSTIIYIVIKY
jgi:hypothetical protein